MNVDRSKLKELAEAIEYGFRWEWEDDHEQGYGLFGYARDHQHDAVLIWAEDGKLSAVQATRDFIAAFNPQTALALLAALEEAESNNREVDDYILALTDAQIGVGTEPTRFLIASHAVFKQRALEAEAKLQAVRSRAIGVMAVIRSCARGARANGGRVECSDVALDSWADELEGDTQPGKAG